MEILDTWKYLTHGNIGHMEISDTWKYWRHENIRHMEILETWKYQTHGNISTWKYQTHGNIGQTLFVGKSLNCCGQKMVKNDSRLATFSDVVNNITFSL